MNISRGMYEKVLFDALELKPFQSKRIKCDDETERSRIYMGLTRAKRRLIEQYPVLKTLRIGQYTQNFDHMPQKLIEITRCRSDELEESFKRLDVMESEILPSDAFRMAQLMKEGLEEGINTPSEVREGIELQSFSDLVKAKMRVFIFEGKKYDE